MSHRFSFVLGVVAVAAAFSATTTAQDRFKSMLQVGPDQGHSNVNAQRMMEFFIENLVIHPPAPSTTVPSTSGR